MLDDDRELARVGAAAGEEPIELELGESTSGGEIRLSSIRRRAASRPSRPTLAEWLAAQASIALENARLHQVVREQAVTDELTGLVNRRRFVEALEGEITPRAAGSPRRCRCSSPTSTTSSASTTAAGIPRATSALRTLRRTAARPPARDRHGGAHGRRGVRRAPAGHRASTARSPWPSGSARSWPSRRSCATRSAARPDHQHRRRPVRVGHAGRADPARGRGSVSRQGAGKEPVAAEVAA